MKKREINRPVIPTKRPRISLDSQRSNGRLRSPKSDIGVLWADQKRIRDEEKLLKNKKRQNNILAVLPKVKKQLAYSAGSTFKKAIRTKKILKRKPIIFAAIFGIILTATISINRDKKDNIDVLGTTGTFESAELPAEQPSFKIALPAGKTLEEVGLRRVSPQNTDPTFVFADEISGIKISVSQQQLPEKFKQDQATELEKLARDFQALNVIQIDDNKIYHGYSEKGNKQSLVFIKNNLLILIAAQGKITDDVWVGYIKSLE